MTNLSLSNARRWLDQIVAGWENACLPADALAPAVASLERHDEIQREMQANANGPDVNDIAARIAAGTITVQEGAEEHMLAGAGQSAVKAGSLMKRVTVVGEAAKRTALERLVEALRGDVVAVLVSAGDELVADVAKLAPTVDGIDSAEVAEAAGSKATKAWQALRELERRHYTLGTIWTALEKLHAIEPGQRPAESRPGVTVFTLVAQLEGAAA